MIIYIYIYLYFGYADIADLFLSVIKCRLEYVLIKYVFGSKLDTLGLKKTWF